MKTWRRLTLETALTAILMAGGAAGAAEAAGAPAGAAVATLVQQGDFWSQKGRKDLAAAAYRRALAADPSNAAARRGLAALSDVAAPNSHGAALSQARALARKGDAAASAAAYRQAFGGATPPDALGLEYYQTLAGVPGGLPQAQAGLRALAGRKPADAEVQLALAQALTYREATRREGVAALSRIAIGGGATGGRALQAWRQALTWMDEAPRNAALFDAYLQVRPGDAEISRKLAAANRPAATAPAAVAADLGSRDRTEGFAALKQGDLAAAEAQFQRALARRANDADALGGLGLARLRAQRFGEAAGFLERAARANPGAAGRWKEALTSARFYAGLQKGQSAMDQGRMAEAEQALRPLTGAAYPDRAMAQNLLAEALRRQGKSAEAEALYRQVLAASPDQAEAQGGLVQVLLDQDRGDEAEALVAQSPALQLDASGQNAVRGRLEQDRANRLWEAGDLTGANSAFEGALAVAPSDPWVRLDFARFLLSQGEARAAEGLMAPVAAGDDPEQLHAAALFADQQGRSSEALALVNRLPSQKVTPAAAKLKSRLEVDVAVDQAKRGVGATSLRSLAARPDLPVETEGRLALALYDLGDREAALSLAQQTLITGVTEAPAHYDAMVTVLARGGQDAEAAALIRQAAARAGSGPQGLAAVADLTATLGAERAERLRQAGDLASAFEVLSAAFAVAPKSPRLLAPLGRVYQSGRMYDEAIQAYGALLRAKPGDKEGLVGLADASAGKGDFASARRSLAQALAAAPRDVDLYLLSARIERQAGDEAAALRALKVARALQQQPFLGMAGGSGLDAILAPGATARSGGLGPNPFLAGGQSPGRAGISQVTASRFELMGSATAPKALVAPPDDGALAGIMAPAGGLYGPAAPAVPVARTGGNPFAAPAARDPVTRDIDRQIAEITSRTAAEVTGGAQVRTRSGEAGLSQLNEVSAKATASTSIGPARLTVSVSPVNIDTGSPAAAALQRFGANQIVNARAIAGAYAPVYPAVGTQSASGAGVDFAVKAGSVTADVGTTPIGFKDVRPLGGIVWSPRLGRTGQATLWIEHRPVTDSFVSYAGTRDTLTGRRYGAVMRTGGGASLSYDNGDAGLYGDVSYNRYTGQHVLENSGYQINLGGYVRPYRQGDTELKVGLNLNQQGFDNNQNFFSLGHGGYFSPKSFTSLTAPVSFATKAGDWTVKAEVAPGYQTYNQASAAYFPRDPALQGELDALAPSNADIYPRYPAGSARGFGVLGSASAEYRFRPGTSVGGTLGFNTFGEYNETTVGVRLRQVLGEGTGQ